MIDGIKMIAKVALIAVITVAILLIFANVQIPGLNFTLFSNSLSVALAIGYHWCPGLSIVFPIAIGMFGIYLSIMIFHFTSIAWRWVFKINE